MAATLTRAEIDTQISTAHAYPRSPARARDAMISLATMDDETASECLYSVPRGGRVIRGPSIRFAEIVLSAWTNVRCAARVTHEDRIERWVEAEALVHDLEGNVGYVARARRRVQLKRGKSNSRRYVATRGSGGDFGCAPECHSRLRAKASLAKALEAVEAVVRGDEKTLVERRDAAVTILIRQACRPSASSRAGGDTRRRHHT